MAKDALAKLLKKAQRQKRLGNTGAARKQLEILLRRDPEHLDGHFLLGTWLAESGHLEPARQHLERARTIAPQSPLVHNNLGNVLRLLGELDAAAAAYRAAVRIDPTAYQAHLNLGMVMADLDRLDEATVSLATAVAMTPGSVDGWRQLARVHQRAARPESALECLLNAVSADPTSVRSRRMLADQHARLGNEDEARRIITELQAETPGDVVDVHLLRAWSEDAPDAPPEGYVARVFDDMALHFDRRLMGTLQCQVPDAIARAVQAVAPGRRWGRGVDLGCGTGQVGERVRPWVDHLAGVDLSAQMIAQAQKKQIYDAVHVGGIEDWLDGVGVFDLLLAGDVLIYVGALERLFERVAAACAPGGLFVFSTETHDGDGITLRRTGRYAHAPAYVDAVAEGCGLQVVYRQPEKLRLEGRDWIEGHVIALRPR